MKVTWKTVICLLLTVSVLDNVTATCPDTHTESWKKKNENCSDGKKYHCQYDAETQLKVDLCATPLQCEAGKRAALRSIKETISCEECGPDMYQPASKWSYEFIQPNCDRRVELCPENTLVCMEATSTQNNLCKCDHTAGHKPNNIQGCGCFDPRTSSCSCINSDCREDEILSKNYTCVKGATGRYVRRNGQFQNSTLSLYIIILYQQEVSVGLIVGVTLACVVVCAIVAVAFYAWRKHKLCFSEGDGNSASDKDERGHMME